MSARPCLPPSLSGSIDLNLWICMYVPYKLKHHIQQQRSKCTRTHWVDVYTTSPQPQNDKCTPARLSRTQVIDSAERYFQVLKENADEDKIVVIKIYAGFCRACKAFDRKFRLLSLDFEEQGANVKFFEMDWMKTRDLCKSLQVGERPMAGGGWGRRGGGMSCRQVVWFECAPSRPSIFCFRCAEGG